LKNSNKNLTSVNINVIEAEPNFMLFSIIHGENAKKLISNYPQLSGMTVFGIFLKGLSVTQEELSRFKTLENGRWINIESRNTDIIKRGKIFFVTKRLDSEDSVLYEKLVTNSFKGEIRNDFQPLEWFMR
jgi:hypothetical protein